MKGGALGVSEAIRRAGGMNEMDGTGWMDE